MTTPNNPQPPFTPPPGNQPGQNGAPFANQPQPPFQPQFQTTFPGAPMPPTGPQAKPRPWFLHPRIIGAAATLIVVAVVAVGAAVFNNIKNNQYQVGSCIHQTSSSTIESVKCEAANADYMIVARFNESEPYFGAGSCEHVTAAEKGWWEGTKGKTGLLLCLKSVG